MGFGWSSSKAPRTPTNKQQLQPPFCRHHKGVARAGRPRPCSRRQTPLEVTILQAVRWGIDAWQEDITQVTIANYWLKSRVLGSNYTPMTRFQAEKSSWKEAVAREEDKLQSTMQQISAILRTFEDEERIKEAVPIQEYIEPASERAQDGSTEEDLVEEIVASYSLTPEDVPNDDLEPVVPIRHSQALAAVQVLKDWEEQQDDSTRQVVRQLRELEQRIKASQISHLEERTLNTYFR
jgi:hypothetical protein